MRDLDWKTWVLLFVIAIGGMFELLKKLPKDKSFEPWDIVDSIRGSQTTHPYNVKPSQEAQSARVRPKTANAPLQVNRQQLEQFIAANTPGDTEFGHMPEKGGEPENGPDEETAKKKERCKDVEDPETGKIVRKCKKKKKKAAGELEVVQDTPLYEEKKKEESKSSDSEESTISEVVTPAPTQPEEAVTTLDEWLRRLLSRADEAETNRFIQEYLAGKITSQIFYQVIAAMLEDLRPEIRAQGVLAAGKTPSYASFQVLAEIIRTEKSGTHLRSYAEGFLKPYTELGKLSVLERALRTGSGYSTILAAHLLDRSARIHLDPEKRPSVDPQTQAPTGHPNAGRFQRFVPILEGLTRASDQRVTSQAQSTLSSLLAMLKSVGLQSSDDPPIDGLPTTAATQPF